MIIIIKNNKFTLNPDQNNSNYTSKAQSCCWKNDWNSYYNILHTQKNT